jgi:hypothetical protein
VSSTSFLWEDWKLENFPKYGSHPFLFSGHCYEEKLVLILHQPIIIMVSYICVLCRHLFHCMLSVVIFNYDDLLSFFFPVLILEQHCWDC